MSQATRPARFNLTSWLFIRLLGLVYFFAFQSALVQITGLIGEQGILPAHDFLHVLQEQLGLERYWLFPTLAWLNSSNIFLQSVCLTGCLASILLMAGIFTGPLLLLLWAFYLSIVTIGQDFYSFQWDILLLEAGFLAIFLLPWRRFEPWLPGCFKRDDDFSPSLLILWLLRLLTFKLMFLSGYVKVMSGDPTWRTLTALDYHYYTQPIPNPIAYFAAQLPAAVQRFSCGALLLIELFIPFLIFAGRGSRLVAAGVLIFLQSLIIVTGNYAFFNLLTISLCLTLLDDAALKRIFPPRLARYLDRLTRVSPRIFDRAALFRTGTVGIVTVFIALMNLSTIGSMLPGGTLPLVTALQSVTAPLRSFYFASSYGLFAVMTTERMEIIVEGSDDGLHWSSYEFPFKPGALDRAPPIVAPYQPRLDWQMWFAALGNYQSNPWFMHFVARLFDGSPDVLRLLQSNPFPDHPPKYLRAEFYRYHFTDPFELSGTGNWWKRDFVEYYLPPIEVSRY